MIRIETIDNDEWLKRHNYLAKIIIKAQA